MSSWPLRWRDPSWDRNIPRGTGAEEGPLTLTGEREEAGGHTWSAGGGGAGKNVTGEGHSIAETPAHTACAPSLQNCRSKGNAICYQVVRRSNYTINIRNENVPFLWEVF